MGIYKTLSEELAASNKQKGLSKISLSRHSIFPAEGSMRQRGWILRIPSREPSRPRLGQDAGRLPAARRRTKKLQQCVPRFQQDLQGGRSGWALARSHSDSHQSSRPQSGDAGLLRRGQVEGARVSPDQKINLGGEGRVSIILLRASMISGFLSSFFSLPFDNAKTKLQKQKKLPDGTLPYKNIFDAMAKTVSR